MSFCRHPSRRNAEIRAFDQRFRSSRKSGDTTVARRRSKKKVKKRSRVSKITTSADSAAAKSDQRKGRKWSTKSSLYHSTDCPAVKRISAANIRSGTAPAALEPHDCIDTSATPTKIGTDQPDPVADRGPQLMSAISLQADPLFSDVATHSTTAIDAPLHPVNTHAEHMNQYSKQPVHPTVNDNTKDNAGGDPVNPYCTCDPCSCTPPCTCGLTKTETQTQTQWDANLQVLRHVTTDLFRPDPAALRKWLAKNEKGPSPASRPYRPPVAGIDQALSHSAASLIKPQMLSTRMANAASAQNDSRQHTAADHAVSVRTADHNGNKIELRTRYEITVNDKPLDIHVGVLDDGSVHCHTIPNYSTASGIDLIKAIIDAFPDDYPEIA